MAGVKTEEYGTGPVSIGENCPMEWPSRLGWLLPVLGALIVFWVWQLVITLPSFLWIMDFFPTWTAARLYSHGTLEAIYTAHPWANEAHPAWTAILLDQGFTPSTTFYAYSPTLLLLVAPVLSRVPLASAAGAMIVVNAASVLAATLALARLLDLRGSLARLGLVLGVGLSFPMFASAWLGQDTPPCFAAALWGAVALLRPTPRLRDDAAVAALWTLAALLKPWFALVWLVPLVLRRYRALGAGILAWVVTFVVVPAAFVPPVLNEGYGNLTRALLVNTVLPANNVSIAGLLLRMAWPDWPSMALRWEAVRVPALLLATEAGLLAILAGLTLLWLRRHPPPRLVLGVGFVWLLLPLTVTWTHYLLFAMVLPLVAWRDAGLPRGLRAFSVFTFLFEALWVPHYMPTVLHGWRSKEAFQAFALD